MAIARSSIIFENDSQLGLVFTKVIATISLLAYTQVSIQAVFSYNPACSRFLSIAAVLIQYSVAT